MSNKFQTPSSKYLAYGIALLTLLIGLAVGLVLVRQPAFFRPAGQQALAPAVFSLQPATATVNPGGQLDIYLELDTSGNTVSGADAWLSYDENFLTTSNSNIFAGGIFDQPGCVNPTPTPIPTAGLTTPNNQLLFTNNDSIIVKADIKARIGAYDPQRLFAIQFRDITRDEVKTKLQNHGQVLDFTNDFLIFYINEGEMIENLTSSNIFAVRLSEPLQSASIQKLAAPAPPSTPDPQVQQIINGVAASQYTTHIQNLQDLVNNSNDAQQTRSSCRGDPNNQNDPNPGNYTESQYIYDHFQSQGWQTRFLDFSFNSGGASCATRNVEAVLAGTNNPNNEIYLVTAHYDSTAGFSSGWNRAADPAPGAEDNASGTAALLTIASALSGYQPQKTIKLVAFSGEEQGLIGSTRYAQRAAQNGDNIVGVINLDMISYQTQNQADAVCLYYGRTDGTLVNYLEDVAQRYNLVSPLTVHKNSSFLCASDHCPFAQRGFDAIMAFEDACSMQTPHYHTLQDQLDTFRNSTSQGTAVTQMVLGAIVELAGGNSGSVPTLTPTVTSTTPPPTPTPTSAAPTPTPLPTPTLGPSPTPNPSACQQVWVREVYRNQSGQTFVRLGISKDLRASGGFNGKGIFGQVRFTAANNPGQTQVNFYQPNQRTKVIRENDAVDVLGSVNNGVYTIAFSPTPTPTTVPASLNFTVHFQEILAGRASYPARQLEIKFYQQGQLITSQTVSLQAQNTGVYTGQISNLAPGTYNVLVKEKTHLTKKFTNVTLDTGTNNLDWSGQQNLLLTGDVVENDQIDLQDFNKLVADFGPRMPKNGSPADLEGDNDVDVFDFNFILENFGKSGDRP